MSYKVQVIVNDEGSDPTAVTYQSIAKAKQVAEGYVTNAIKKGWKITSRTTDLAAEKGTTLKDEDGDQVRIVIEMVTGRGI